MSRARSKLASAVLDSAHRCSLSKVKFEDGINRKGPAGPWGCYNRIFVGLITIFVVPGSEISASDRVNY